ncbi:hypothetical protein KSU1_D0955 [Candidatus Jettenia caeni]|uniref:Uncharacterized protein n=1 Tax=Candidatus Jettenia caeni TaxID=247490 RepID=I3IRB9_9BACT|nr:hypothetical protein [Candidatus Jettenia sp. AMX1]WKZ15665.1 MAG: hypothetical protein QY317_17395 [Candidatus Jettenia caeni]GAB64264.1 hypothetical protein KSU1_D0955 [Candidatus Jettenia caeni]
MDNHILSGTSGTGGSSATTTTAGITVSVTTRRHSKQGEQLMDMITLTGWTKELFLFGCTPEIFVKLCIALVALKFVYWHSNYSFT